MYTSCSLTLPTILPKLDPIMYCIIGGPPPGGLPLRSGFTVGFCVPCCSSFSPSFSRLECSWICLCLSSAGASAKVAPHFSHVYLSSLSGLLIFFVRQEPMKRIVL